MSNPAGVWELRSDLKMDFWAPGYGVYGYVYSEPNGLWFWEARPYSTMSSKPIIGKAPSMKSAQKIVETILWETGTVERGQM